MSAVVEGTSATAVLGALLERGGSVAEDDLAEFVEGLRAPWKTLEALLAAGDVAAVTVERCQVVALTRRGMHRASQEATT